MSVSMEDYDTYDTVYDAVVTTCYIEEDADNDSYDKFCIELMKKVEIVSKSGDGLLVKWTEFIEKNMNKFVNFTDKYWSRKYRDDKDEFIYQWINEIHYYLAGYVSEDFYDILVEFVETLEA